MVGRWALWAGNARFVSSTSRKSAVQDWTAQDTMALGICQYQNARSLTGRYGIDGHYKIGADTS